MNIAQWLICDHETVLMRAVSFVLLKSARPRCVLPGSERRPERRPRRGGPTPIAANFIPFPLDYISVSRAYVFTSEVISISQHVLRLSSGKRELGEE